MAAVELSRAFPDGFTWGSATAAHQIEGGNVNNDWWAFEHTPGSGCAEPSGDCCDSWNRWQEDADLVAGLGFDNYRFSVEWSRIEPAEGEISRAALEHYRRQCLGLREQGVDPVVTFHHFTTPRWLTAQGGWESDATIEHFGRFCTVVADALGDVMTRACTINEPNVVATMGWHAGMFPPGKTDVALSREVAARLAAAHRVSVDAIRAAAPGVPVGLTLSMTDYQLAPGGEEKLENIRHHSEDIFLDVTDGDDFVGVQVYTRMLIGPNGWAGYEEGVPILDMGYEFYPASLANCLRRAWDYTGGAVPLLVTENGIGTTDDEQRIDYVRQALAGVLDVIDEGIDVRGYTYWSLLDNF
jgi:beta-glucosidase